MAEVSRKYRGLEGHACPRCAKEGVWTHLRWCPTGVTGDSFFTRTSDRHLFDDDVDVSSNGAIDFDGDFPDDVSRAKAGVRWLHHYQVVCPRCNLLLNVQQHVFHVFKDDELPMDYWDNHDETIRLMRARGVSDKMIAAHERTLEKAGIRRPE